MNELFDKLAEPFPPERISWRVGAMTKDKAKGMALAYLDARDVMQRLDEACGPDGWQNRYSHVGGVTVCEIGIRIGPHGYDPSPWLWKADGAGATDVEAEKGALSDAFKRAAVRWGIGRYLYDVASPWVEVDEYKHIKESEFKKLEELLQAYSTTFEWGSPESRATLRLLLRTVQSFNTADDVRRFREDNEGTIAQLRVKARERLNEELERVVTASEAKAA